MSTTARKVGVMLLLAVSAAAGCGESPPPALTPEKFDEAKKERTEIIKKEYGGGSAPSPKK